MSNGQDPDVEAVLRARRQGFSIIESPEQESPPEEEQEEQELSDVEAVLAARRRREEQVDEGVQRAQAFPTSGLPSDEEVVQAVQERRRRQAEGPSDLERVLGAVVSQAPEFMSFLGSSVTPGIQEGELQFGAGFVSGVVSGVGEPILNLAELPAEIAEEVGAEGVAEGILGLTKKGRDGIKQFNAMADAMALEMGASPDEVIASKVWGGFAGFSVPLFGSFKAAGILTGLRGTSFPGLFVRDLAAGAIMGLGFTEGDVDKRVEHAKEEGAFFGAWSLALGGALLVPKAYRLGRLGSKLGEARLKRLIDRVEEVYNPETGLLELRNLPGQEGRAVLEVLTEEQLILESGRARKVWARTADERALVPAIQDAAKGETTTGIIKGVKEPQSVLQKLQKEFPDLNFRSVERGASKDVLFSSETINNKLLSRFSSEGRFPGQRVLAGGQEFEYVGKARAEGRIRLRRVDSKTEVNVPEEIVQDLPFGTPREVRKGPVESLSNEFADEYMERLQRVVNSRADDLTEEELIRMVSEGQLNLSDAVRRDWPTRKYWNVPEEMGIRSKTGFHARAVPETMQSRGTMVFEVTNPEGRVIGEVSGSFESPEIFRVDNFIVEGGAGTLSNAGIRDVARDVVRQLPNRPKTVFGFRTSGAGAGREQRMVVDDLLGETTHGMDPQEIRKLVQDSGTEFVKVMHPAEPATFQDLVKSFLGQKGLLSNVEGIKGAAVKLDGEVFVGETHVQAIVKGVNKKFGTNFSMIDADNVASKFEDFFGPGGSRADELNDMMEGIGFQTTEGRFLGQGSDEALEVARQAGHTDMMGSHEIILRGEPVNVLAEDSKALVEALTARASEKVRQRLWESIPEKERKLLEELRDEALRVAEDAGPFLEQLAGQRGFQVRRSRGGDIALREVNGGLTAIFKEEEAAIEALRGVQRRYSNEGGRVMLPHMDDGSMTTSHLPPADDFLLTGQENPRRVMEKLTPRPRIINKRDWAAQFEEGTGIPVWSQGFEPLDRSREAMQTFLEPWMKRAFEIWKPLSREERAALDPFFQEIAGRQLGRAEIVRIGKRMGLDAKQIRAAEEALKLERAIFTETGLGPERYLDNHFARIRPVVQREETIVDAGGELLSDVAEGMSPSVQAWFKQHRMGELAMREADPLVVQIKYLRSVGFDKHMKGPWERAAAMMGPRQDPFWMSKMPPSRRQHLIEFFGGNEKGVRIARDVSQEFLGRFRGYPSMGEETARRIISIIKDRMGLNIPEELVEQVVNQVMSFMYGAAMGGRPRMWTRNLTQNLWFNYMRLDPDLAGASLQQALTIDGYMEALQAGAVRPRQRGVPFGEVLTESHLANLPTGDKAMNASMEAVFRRLLAAGEVGQKASSSLMVLFGSSDDLNRVWAYHWQKMHTDRWLRRFQEGKVSQKRFVDEGMPYYSPATKREFARRFDLMGEETALRFAGKQNADEAHFLYSASAQPPWMQGPVGKLGGMFGTYSLHSKEYLMRLMRYGSPRQQARAIAKGAITGTSIGLVATEMGFDLSNWMSPISFLTYTGGPALELALAARDVARNLTWAPDQSITAAERLMREGMRLAFPGQGLVHDLDQSLSDTDDIGKAALSIMLGRPENVDGNFFMETQMFEDDLFVEKGLKNIFQESTSILDVIGQEEQ